MSDPRIHIQYLGAGVRKLSVLACNAEWTRKERPKHSVQGQRLTIHPRGMDLQGESGRSDDQKLGKDEHFRIFHRSLGLRAAGIKPLPGLLELSRVAKIWDLTDWKPHGYDRKLQGEAQLEGLQDFFYPAGSNPKNGPILQLQRQLRQITKISFLL